MTRANNWRSIGRISWRTAPFKSFNVGLCECKHAISNIPKGRNHTFKDRDNEVATVRLRNGKWGCPGNMFRTVVIDSFVVCTMAPSCWKWPTQRKRMLTTSSPLLGLPTEYYPFKRCQVPVGHPVVYELNIWNIYKTNLYEDTQKNTKIFSLYYICTCARNISSSKKTQSTYQCEEAIYKRHPNCQVKVKVLDCFYCSLKYCFIYS